MRRYWQPAALSEELTADKPLPVTLFGEELILFRDGQGNPGLIGRYCAHQGMDMIYSRVEPDGIRCLYHGWLFDTCGKVVVRGDWFPGGEQRLAVGQPAYPCAEIGGMIFTYLGSDESPALPAGEILSPARQKFSRGKLSARNSRRRGSSQRREICRAEYRSFEGALRPRKLRTLVCAG